MEVPRKRRGRRTNVPDYPLDVPSTAVRQALFPSGPGSYPSQIAPLCKAAEDRHDKFTCQPNNNWALNLPSEHKWREMGWNTSSPAEYVAQAKSKDFKQTLAYAEDLEQRQELLNLNDVDCAIQSPMQRFSKGGHFARSPSFSSTTTTATTRELTQVGSAQSGEELSLLKHTMLRERLLVNLHDLIKTATPPHSLLQPHLPPREPLFDISKGAEMLQLLLQLRDVGVLVLESILRWHELHLRLAPMAALAPFRFENRNYCVKMVSDMNFLSTIKTLGSVLGVNPSTMKQNPFMMRTSILERDFQGLRGQAWQSLRLFANKDDSIQRVMDAEKYLMWCLLNLQNTPVVLTAPSPVRSPSSSNSPLHRKWEQQRKLTWQKRAEKQLEMLSMPLESLTGSAHVQDSSNLMKRKGVLPSLPLVPPKTLRELMGNVHQSVGEEEDCGRSDNNCTECLQASWSGKEFSATAVDFEALGALKVPPHHMVTLVAACVLILLSPADQLPKDLSWCSCQKMLRHGRQLIHRVQVVNATGVPAFKLKRLVPFLQNAQFQPNFVAQFSCAASCMCAWVFSVLRTAQQQDYERLGLHTCSGIGAGNDEDHLVLLSELEVDVTVSPQLTKADPLPRSRNEKRVSIGSTKVLFINENKPMKCSSRGSPRCNGSSSGSSTKIVLTNLHGGRATNTLLRTSTWTYCGVVYFVSFFLEQSEERSQQQQDEESSELADERRLMIKIYEPMSSVESQMTVDAEDLRQDFGKQSLSAFQCGQYHSLCELMLQKLDRMMDEGNAETAPLTPPQQANPISSLENEPEESICCVWSNSPRQEGNRDQQLNALNLLLQDPESGLGDDDALYVSGLNKLVLSTRCPRPDTPRELDTLEASALTIQCMARQQQARAKVSRIRVEKKQKEKMEMSALRIQCAVRQKQARHKVNRVRAEKRRVETIIEIDEEMVAAVEEVEPASDIPAEVVVPESRPMVVMGYSSDPA